MSSLWYHADRAGGWRRCVAAAILAALFAALTLPLALREGGTTSEASDEREYHLPLIRQMAEQWPWIGLRDYRSATTPLYHLTMATVSRYVTDEVVVLRLINVAIGAALLLSVMAIAARYVPPWQALAAVLPLACSSYVIGAAAWLTTDNLGWLWVSLVLGSALAGATSARAHLYRSTMATLAVLTRQIHLWVVAVMVVVEGTGARRHEGTQEGSGFGVRGSVENDEGRSPKPQRMTNDEDRVRAIDNRESQIERRKSKIENRKSKIARAIACLPPVLAVAVFAAIWGGLTPPSFRTQHAGGVNPAMAPLALSLAGAYGLFFLPAAWGARRAANWVPWTAATFALLAAIVIPSAYNKDAGRWGGAMWEVAHRLPAPFGRSIVLVMLAPIGAIVLGLLYHQAKASGRGRPARIMLIAMAAWLAAQCFNSQAWQRYAEPMVLIGLAALACMGRGGDGPARSDDAVRWWVGPLCLAVLLLAYNLIVTYSLLPSPLP